MMRFTSGEWPARKGSLACLEMSRTTCRFHSREGLIRWEIVDGGFFSGKSAFFHIEVKKFKNLVKRKALDFQWLRDTICKEYQGSYVWLK
jgi:hypothetical protein